ncbi:MAG: DUF1540 domain-containing protein [Oscillospiraceae bacterium]|nr:DUF1540 domain-containing protein [Oscillospiraceae bacterium]
MMNFKYDDNESYNAKEGRIVCDVTNCAYNNDQRHCTANQIKVGPQYASSSADTICVTFKQ